MRALTIRQPLASLIALGVKHIETRSWCAPQSLIGQTIAIHAGKHKPPTSTRHGQIGNYRFDRYDDEWYIGSRSGGGPKVYLPLGAVVATATLADCLPMVDYAEEGRRPNPWNGRHRLWPNVRPGELWRTNPAGGSALDVSDQLPYGDFAPGRWAWMLTNVQPTTERCPNDCSRFGGNVPGWTRGSSFDWVPCGVCGGAMKCPPIPAKGRQGVWTWQP